MMKTKQLKAALSISVLMSSRSIAGEIRLLHDGSVGLLTSGYPRLVKLKGVCPTGTSPGVVGIAARIRDALPVKDPNVRLRIHRLTSNSCTAAIAASGKWQTDQGSNTSLGDGDNTYSLYSTLPAVKGDAFLIEVSKSPT